MNYPEHLYRRAELISIAEAAAIARRSPNTMRAWCARYGIAVSLLGRWAVNRIALRLALNKDREAFRAFMRGELDHPAVAAAYRQEDIALPSSARPEAA